MPSIPLNQLVEQNEELRSRVDLCGEDAVLDEVLRNDLVDQVVEFLQRLQPHAASVASTAEYDVINRIASEWQVTLSSVFNRPIDVRQLLKLPLPQANLRPSPRSISRDDVFRSLQIQADDIATKRKLTGLIRQVNLLNCQVSQFTKSPDLIHANIPSDEVQMHRDFYDACLFFGVKVLNGTIRMADQLEASTYEFLEGIWLNDVKRLMAYISWELAGEPDGTPDHRSFYLEVCSQLHARLLDPKRKAGGDSFERVCGWIEGRYLTGRQLRPDKSSAARELIEEKAERIWKETGSSDSQANWRAAENYAMAFYQNIIPAIRDKSHDAAAAVLAALHDRDDGLSAEVVNAFEAAIVLEFLPSEIVRRIYRMDHSFV